MSNVPSIRVSDRGNSTEVESLDRIAEFRPRFVFWTSFLAQVPLQLFFSFWGGGFFGGMIHNLTPGLAEGLRRAGFNPFVVVGGLVFVGFPLISLVLKLLNYRSTVYQIHRDRIVIKEGFLTQHRKEIALAAVREINLRRGVLQRVVSQGSIYVATQATGVGQGWSLFSASGASSTFGSGAMLRDLDEAEAAYECLATLRKAQFDKV